ncbi:MULTISPECIES: class I SAM-dependent methyltransferase [unclassified Mycobacterium]|uniref:class I SAM-dependent methyltransferase n=1 Tax=unclassified Mycobacterium TaxID=2642494 RepID=UPI000566F104|nr:MULTISPECIES: class I SAM-dependent methyltransferase [unclassified Mycobacterium]SEB18092.1 Methyltransferase domain-containing protein [Mycobacterium sp. 283mftsu]
MSESEGNLFAGTAWHYARFRPNYPAVVINELVQQLRLDGTGRLLDLGCGTGQLTLPLAGHVAEAVGVDPESGMLAEATRQAEAQGVTNVFWRQGSSAHLPTDLGRFSIATIGRAFHWMDRAQVLIDLGDMVDDDGSLVIVNDTNLLLPSAPWQQAIQDIQRSFIPRYGVAVSPSSVDDSRTHEQILVSSPFSRVGREVYRYRRSWTIERIVGYLYSTSLPLRRLLGDRQGAFEEALRTTLLSINPSGHFTESVALEVLTATKT